MDFAPRNYGGQTSLLAALSFGRRVIALITLAGAVDTSAFDAYLTQVLGPHLRKGDVFVLDNLGVHHASQVEQIAAGRGEQVVWLLPYSPDYSPIKQCWLKLKTALRAAKVARATKHTVRGGGMREAQ